LLKCLLKKNKTLDSLYLCVNAIGDTGAKFIGEAIARNNTLKTLSLMSNEIADDGAAALAEGLKKKYYIN